MALATSTNASESPAVDHQAFSSVPVRLGGRGVNLSKSVDTLDPDELARGTNIVTGQGGGLDTRPGLTTLVTGGANVHSAYRLNDPFVNDFTRFWGYDGNWGRVKTGGIVALEGGFSGDPLTMVPWQTELSGPSWMYVADRNKMRKASLTSGSTAIGLPVPLQPVAALAEDVRTLVASFDASDGTGAASWTVFPGASRSNTAGGGLPVLSDVAGIQNNAVNMLTSPGSTVGTIGSGTTSHQGAAPPLTASQLGYASIMAIAKVANLSTLNAGARAATDEDIIHVWMKLDKPNSVDEIRLYLVCSAFNAATLAIPGTASSNLSAYLRSFRPSDYTAFIAGVQIAPQAGAIVRGSKLLAGYKDPLVTEGDNASTTGKLGANVWWEFGIIGLPVRRSDFVKIGNAGAVGEDWSTITGIVIVVQTSENVAVNVAFDELYLTGGGNPDTSEPDSLSYDYRVTDYDITTGAESNPSAVMVTFNESGEKIGGIEALRQRIVITPQGAGRPNIRQRAYRRGGSVNDTWFGPVGQNTVDGGQIVDDSTDLTAVATGSVLLDHDQPITTADANGTAVYAQPVPVIFGPIEGYLFAIGDPYRPGDLYWCKRDEPDHWPAANHNTCCPPSEQLMNGGKLTTGQGFAFSRERLYSVQVNTVDGTITTAPTECAEGLAGRWAFCVGPGGIYFVTLESVRVTTGGASKNLADDLRPLFRGQTKNGYFPIDFTQPNKLRLGIIGDDLWFGFQDTNGSRVWWIYSFTYDAWRFAQFDVPTGMVYSEPNTQGGLSGIIGGTASGKGYLHAGFTDDGAAIACNARTGAMDLGKPREEKLLGDLTVFGDLGGSTLTVQTFLNPNSLPNVLQTIVGIPGAGYTRYLFDGFGTTPQHAQSVSVDLSWSGMPAAIPTVQQLIIDVAIQPEITMNRATTWQPLNNDGEAYLTGMWIDCDTGGSPRAILVEGLLSGLPVAVATLSVTSASGRRKWFSWPAAHVDMVRLRPTGACDPWMLFGQGWLSTPEPPRIAVWDTGFESLGDTYYTGLDLEVDTFGATKLIDIYVDNVVVLAAQPITANGRYFRHVTLPWGRGHIYRFVATDGNVGLLYAHKWIVEAEPGEQTNWNQNFTIAGTRADKYLKGVTIECDTFNAIKQVTIEVDGVVTSTQPVQANGRKVVQVAFPQVLGRVFRLFPTDTNPGRLYSLGWIFDEEPYQLTRFETQEQRHAIDEWQIPEYACVTYKSTAVVTLTVLGYGQNGTLLSNHAYPLASTAGVKSLVWVPFIATKGVLYKYIFTSAQGFWLYREESFVELQPWPGGQRQKQKPFGNDDLDLVRSMHDAVGVASRSGGGEGGS